MQRRLLIAAIVAASAVSLWLSQVSYVGFAEAQTRYPLTVGEDQAPTIGEPCSMQGSHVQITRTSIRFFYCDDTDPEEPVWAQHTLGCDDGEMLFADSGLPYCISTLTWDGLKITTPGLLLKGSGVEFSMDDTDSSPVGDGAFQLEQISVTGGAEHFAFVLQAMNAGAISNVFKARGDQTTRAAGWFIPNVAASTGEAAMVYDGVAGVATNREYWARLYGPVGHAFLTDFALGANALNRFKNGQPGNVSVDPPSIGLNSTGTATATVTGLAANAACSCSIRTDFHSDLIMKDCYSTADTLNVRLRNLTGSPIDAGAQTVDYTCWEKY